MYCIQFVPFVPCVTVQLGYRPREEKEPSRCSLTQTANSDLTSRSAFYRQRNQQLELNYAQYATVDGSTDKTWYTCPQCAWRTSRGVGMMHRHVTTVHAWGIDTQQEATRNVWR